MEVMQNGSTILMRWYAGSRYMKETAGSTTREYTWIGGDAYTAPCVAVKTNTSSQVYYYLLRDYLGNITHQVNMSNTVVAEYSFDSWGRRRDKDDWTYNLVGEPELFAGRGFTAHEWLPWFNLYNMNGRLYDPVVGRFLSPDNYVQMPDNTQNFNRYSYCINNPLKYTDPSGEIIFTILAAIFAPPLLPVAIAADIGGIINTVNHWDAIKNSDNFWQGFAKGAGLYGLGGANGALTYTSAGIGTFAGGFIEELGSGLITGETDDLLAKSFVSGGTQYLGGKIASKVSDVTSKGLTKLGLENRLAKNIISDVAGAIPGTFTATTAKSYLGYGKSFKESIQDGVRSIPGATLSGIGSGITKTVLTNQRAARIEKIRQNPAIIDPYYDFQWQPSNNQYYQPLTPKVPI